MSALRIHWTALLMLAPGVALAQPSVDVANDRANDTDRELAAVSTSLTDLKQRYGLAMAAPVTKVERRLRQGEVHFLLQDYLRASIALMDVVDDPTQSSHPRYDDCVFLLAESLRSSRNFAGARRYYTQILDRSQGERLKDVVLGLLEIAGATGRFDKVDGYISRLRDAQTLSRPDVDYIYGKMLFRSKERAKVERAHKLFSSIPPNNSVSARAAYYAGVSLAQLGEYEQAVEQFKATLTRIPQGPSGAPLRDLTHLSLGRLFYEIGEVSQSADTYQAISQDSPYFADMLYEVAWVQVEAANQDDDEARKRKAYNRALRATELLMATAPDSRLYPQARILQGNLMIRLGASENAYDTFQTIVDDYGDARSELMGLIRTNDPRVFFDQLLAADLARIDSTQIIPPLALTWALDEDQVSRAVGMQKDLSDSETFMRESRELVDTLELALAGE
ncbi:MAG: tetratricopeptide repeat protein, partial [Myxococcota bacterium]